MKTKIIAAVAALATIALTTGVALARNVQDNCANVLANPGAYTTADVKLCETRLLE